MKLLNKFLSLVSVFVLVFSQISAPFVVLAQEATPSASEGPFVETVPQEEQSLELPTPTPTPIIEFTPLPMPPIPEPSQTPEPTVLPQPGPPPLVMADQGTPVPLVWNTIDGVATTTNPVVLNQTYTAPQEGKATVMFTKLPENPGTLSFKQITLTQEEQEALGAFSDTAYEITSTMQDGTFEYNLTLPLPNEAKDKDVEVKSSESLDNLGSAKKVDQPQEKKSDTITITDLNHFTLFIVTTVTDFNNGTSSSTTTTDVGSGDGSVTNTLGSETQDQSQTTGTTKETFDNVNWVAQTFTANITGLLTKARLSLDRASNTNGDVTVEIRNTSSGSPGTTVLATTSRPATDLTTSQANYDFTFSSPAAITSGTVYAIVVYRSGSGTITANYDWYRAASTSSNNPYTSGGGYTSSNSGSSWTIRSSGNGDQIFTTFVRSYATSGTQTSDVLDTSSTSTVYSSLSWNETLPSGTDITFEVRSSNTSFAKTDVTPSWSSLGGTSPITVSSVTGRYFQWRATLTGTATTTPTLQDVTVTYNRQPNTPSLSSPANGSATTDSTPGLTWVAASPIDPDSSDTVTYEVQVDNNSDFSSTEYAASNLSATSATSSALNDDTYYFRVRATDNNGFVGNWTSSRTFTVLTTGTIVIVKNSIPDDSQDFSFTTTGNGLADFSLDDDADNTLSIQKAFNSLVSGVYTVAENGVNGWQLTGLTCDDSSTVDLESRTATIDVDAGEIVTCTFTNTKLGSISGYKFIDTNGNGVWDENEDPDSEWTITLSGGSSDETTTDEDGYYTFEELLPGTYHICESIDDDEVWTQTLPSGNNSCDDGTSWHEVGLSAGENVTDKNFGNFRYGRISGQKFEDLDGDGVKDDGESGLSGWTIFLDANDNGELDNDETSVETDGDGNYKFTGLIGGTYMVREVLQNGWVQKTDNQDITITSGSDETVNFGNFKKVIIDVYKWKDLDADGVWDKGEPAVGGWDMTLSKETITAASTENPDGGSAFSNLIVVPTAEDGKASFEVDEPANYRVTEEDQANFQRTHPTDSFFDIFVGFSGQTTEGSESIVEDHNGQPLRFGNAPFQQLDGAKFVPTSGDGSSTNSLVVLGDSTISVSNNGGTSTVSLPDGTVITRIDGSTIDSSLLSAQDVSTGSLSNLGTGVVADGAMQWGIPNLGLTFSTPITLSIFVGTALNGQTLNVQRSVDGVTWTSDGIVSPATCLVASGLCTFQATKASFYAVTHTVSTASSSTTSSDGGGGTASMPGAPACNDSKPGSAPTLISATSGTNSVTLSWTKAADPTTYYLVTYGNGPGLQQYGNPSVGGADVTTYTVSGLSGGTTYYFRVRAGNGCAPGDYSNEVSAAPGGGFIEGPAAGFIPGVLGTQTEEQTQGEIKGEEISASPSPVPIQPTQPSVNIFEAIGNFFKSIFNFFGKILGM